MLMKKSENLEKMNEVLLDTRKFQVMLRSMTTLSSMKSRCKPFSDDCEQRKLVALSNEVYNHIMTFDASQQVVLDRMCGVPKITHRE